MTLMLSMKVKPSDAYASLFIATQAVTHAGYTHYYCTTCFMIKCLKNTKSITEIPRTMSTDHVHGPCTRQVILYLPSHNSHNSVCNNELCIAILPDSIMKTQTSAYSQVDDY